MFFFGVEITSVFLSLLHNGWIEIRARIVCARWESKIYHLECWTPFHGNDGQ